MIFKHPTEASFKRFISTWSCNSQDKRDASSLSFAANSSKQSSKHNTNIFWDSCNKLFKNKLELNMHNIRIYQIHQSQKADTRTCKLCAAASQKYVFCFEFIFSSNRSFKIY